jgi:hypothetical protein
LDEDGKPSELHSELGDYRYTYRDGVLLMESKKEYKKRVKKSPDNGDAWILTHIPGSLIPQPPQPTWCRLPCPVSLVLECPDDKNYKG